MVKTQVSPEDEWLLSAHPWRLDRKGYVMFQKHVDGKPKVFLLHRMITNAPDGMVVDHIDGDPGNNRRENLRVCTHQQNIHNSRRAKNNTSGVKGVTCRSWGYEANIKVNGRPIYLGSYPSLEEAAKAYQEAAKAHFGEFARFN